MGSLFDTADRNQIVQRLMALQPGSGRLWGTMNPAQMLTHCSIALEAATGDRPLKQKFVGWLLSRFFRATALGERRLGKNGPTDPSFVVLDERDFDAERTRLIGLVDRFVQRGPGEAAKQQHVFFGRMSGEEWGVLMYKHLDHHLRQFGA